MMQVTDEPYLTLSKSVTCEIDAIKGSRFIAIAAPIVDNFAAEVLLKSVKEDYPDARHHCWAYQLCYQQRTRFSDDGEPSGSAGKPILAPIVGRQLMDSIVVVVRYFGGVKLGVGGLVRAYGQACNAVLDLAEAEKVVTEIIPKISLQLTYSYELTSQVATALAKLGLSETAINYTDQVQSMLKIKRCQISEVSEMLTNFTAGRIQIQIPE